MTATAVFLAVATAVSMVLELRVLAVIFLAGTLLGAFVGGYCYRQRVLDIGKQPHEADPEWQLRP
jgi:hypothetical protein